MDLQEVTAVSAAIIAVSGAVLALWRLPVTQRVWRWFDRHRSEDRDARQAEIITAVVAPMLDAQDERIEARFAPRLAVLDARTEQLVPNGGKSIYDRLTRIEDQHVVFSDSLQGLTSDVRVLLRTTRKDNP